MQKMHLLQMITAAVALLFLLSGCGKDPLEERRVLEPEWYDPAATVEDEGRIYGYGQGESTSRSLAENIAESEARASIAVSVSGEVAGLLEQTASDMDTEVIETAREAMEDFFEQELYGVQVDRRELIQDEDTQEYRAFYRVHIDAEAYNDMLEAAKQDRELSSSIPAHDETMEALDEARQRDG